MSDARTFALDDLPTCEPTGPYRLRAESGQIATTDEQCWTTLAALVSATGADPSQVRFTEVADASGEVHPLGAGDLTGGFEDGDLPAVASNGSALTYARPLRSDADVNLTSDPDRDGYFQTSPAQGQTLVVRAHLSGDLLAVDATSSVVRGHTVAYVGTVDAPPPGVAFDWTLADGTTLTGSRVRHTFADDARSFTGILVVTGSDGSWGRAIAYGSFVAPTAGPSPSAPPGGSGGPSGPAVPGPPMESAAPGRPSSGPTGSAVTPSVAPSGTSGGSSSRGASTQPTRTSPVRAPMVRGVLLRPASGDSQVAPQAGAVPDRPASIAHAGIPGWLALVAAVLILAASGALVEVRAMRRAVRQDAPR